jgi:signal transduction histidine kinase
VTGGHELAPSAPRDSERRRLLRFLRKLPHDFANAILPFQIAGDLLRRANGDPVVIEQVRRILDEQSVHARRLIEDLDRAARVLRGDLEVERHAIDLRAAVEQGIAAARARVSPAVVIETSSPAAPVELAGDGELLAAAVEELVDNAARFAGDQTIQVELERTADAATVRVRDRGPGIASDRLDSVFEPFAGSEAMESGWGVGLGFARLVAIAHGGSLTLAAGDDGRGLVATLRLPLSR